MKIQSNKDIYWKNTNFPIIKPIWITIKESIRVSGIQRTNLYKLIKNGTIKSIKIGGKRLVSFASIEALEQGDAK